ncbi:CbtA family protein [Afifella sp. IM 167]|uniref:CbtA family protein n=1 Tax=Afifella sp. IM 167 TaxID=2033586 RepID=UPI001CCEE677|nr:CbtA family protein [Afifella sp. IM 167]MBZ8132584.1 cobalt transporter [Afifella sp. IM 167]
MFRNIVLSAAAAGLLAGLVAASFQYFVSTPLILEAEKYETAAAAPGLPAAPDGAAVAMSTHGEGEAHDHAGAAWAPEDGLERTLYTSAASIVLSIGYALMLLGAMAASGRRIEARGALLFGLGAFAATALAPALGLPPELPGSAAGELAARQLWWVATAAATAIGLAAMFLSGNWAIRIVGVAILIVPHVVGAPPAPEPMSGVPAELAGHFAAVSLVLSAITWSVIGLAGGAVYRRLAEGP